ncbi:MAG: GntR family transcriptional regulator [Defluviitaleaceae bacterium]|nr:GntR family transcriptional regulator [Defluviitaleaceae bacterium]MCL2836525.1 GntR family transcriptional regulator [Defluviitaleaceae bacterium]
MIIKLDTTSATPIYVQLRNQIVMGIGRGELKIGEGLPTVRQMAEDIGINTMTVNKTYAILKQEGYIEIDRRHGAKVSPKVDLSGRFREKVEIELTLLIAESSLKGMNRDDFMKVCADVYSKLNLSYSGGTA